MSDEARQVFRRYADLIAGAMAARGAASAISFDAEGDSTVQVERGAVYGRALDEGADVAALGVQTGRLIEIAARGDVAAATVVDRLGHQRPVYRPLLVYTWLQAFRALYEVLPRAEFGKWDEALRAWCDLLEAELGEARVAEGPVPAARGGTVVRAAWGALALSVAGKVFVRDAWTDLASDTFGRLVRGQTEEGTFLRPSPSDNRETWWFDELVLLHAAGSYAVQAEDRTVAAAVKRATEYHLRETQPDHATERPWALFPFIWNEHTRPLADQVLHSAAVRAGAGHGAGGDGLSLTLLADALYCLRLFERPAP